MLHTALRVLSRSWTLMLWLELCGGTNALARPWQPVGPSGVAMITGLGRGRTALYAATCNGVFRSDDGGASWREAGLQRRCVVRLAVQPGDSDTLYAIVDNQIFTSLYPEPSFIALSGLFLGSSLSISRDGAASWGDTSVLSGHAVAVDPTRPGTAYVANYDSIFGPIAVTHDSGLSWARMDGPSSILVSLAVGPADGTLHAAWFGGLSTYANGSWSSYPANMSVVAAGSGAEGTVYAAGQFFCRRSAAETQWTCSACPTTSPQDIAEIPESGTSPRRLLLLGFDGMWLSDDAGATWAMAQDHIGYSPAAAYDPSRSTVYFGNDAGVFRSVDRGATWTNSSTGLSSMWVRALAVDPVDGNTVWAGGEGRLHDVSDYGPGLFRSRDSAVTWTPASTGLPGYVFSLALDRTDSMHLVVGSFGRIHQSHDGGASWGTAEGLGGFVHGLAADPHVPGRVWAAAQTGLLRSYDGGETWSHTLSKAMYSVLFDERTTPARIYAGSSFEDAGYYSPFGSGFFVQSSADDGRSWRTAREAQGAAAVAFAVDRFSPDAVYAGTYDGSILRTADAGATWEIRGVVDSVQIMALAADPLRADRLYAATWGGVYRSLDGGRTWEPFSEGLVPYGAFGLAVSADGTWLYAGTTGGGVFRRSLFASEREPPDAIAAPRTPRIVPRP